MRKLIFKISFFCAVLFIYIMALSFLPLDIFTFRNWESLLWGTDFKPTPGRFYPKKNTLRDEFGDLGHGTKYARVKKNIRWETDEYGFRNKQGIAAQCPIILVGDSYSVGTGVSQNAMLSAKLTLKTKTPVYNYSPIEMDRNFFDNLAAMHIQPFALIYETSGHVIPKEGTFLKVKHSKIQTAWKRKINDLFNTDFFMRIAIVFDRFWKKEPFRYLQSRIDSAFGVFPEAVQVDANGMMFHNEILAMGPTSHEEIKRSSLKIKKISDFFQRRGIDFIFVSIPPKSAVYFDLRPGDTLFNKDFYMTLKHELDLLGVKSIDVFSSFRSRVLSGEQLYSWDDTHWNEAGIEVAAQLIAQKINSKFQPAVRDG
ncbi:MAG TPA: hypothetical protein PLO78_04080 [Candidatus Omnitrophota bacterium]|nr:hypothetical protein [Candidatus Omnitrophota bacterium]